MNRRSAHTQYRSALFLALVALGCNANKHDFSEQQPSGGGEAGQATTTSPHAGEGNGGSSTGATSNAGGEGGVVTTGNGGEAGQADVACTADERRCAETGQVPQVCDANGAWKDEAACEFACVDGFCRGDCVPDKSRCDSKTDVPQLCSATGEWENQPACGADRACSAGECLCTSGLTTCGDECVTLTNDADNCGSCGHSCLGGACVDSKCQPVELAAGLTQATSLAVDATHVYWMDYNGGVGNVKRVAKSGGAAETLATNGGTPGGVVVTGGKIYWGGGTSNSKGAVANPAIQVANVDGTSRVAFAPITQTVDKVALSNDKIFWNERNTSVAFFSKAIAGGNVTPAGTHTNNSNMFSVAGNCVYFRTFVNSVYGLSESCAGATAVGRYSSTTNIILSAHDAADSTMLYFGVRGSGIYRLPITQSAQATRVIVGIESKYPIVDGNQLYYIDGDTGGAPACTTNWGIYRTNKQPDSERVTLLAPPLNCPDSLTTDDKAIYWLYLTTGAVMKMAK